MFRAHTAHGVMYTPTSTCAALRPSLTICVSHPTDILLLIDLALDTQQEHSKRWNERSSKLDSCTLYKDNNGSIAFDYVMLVAAAVVLLGVCGWGQGPLVHHVSWNNVVQEHAHLTGRPTAGCTLFDIRNYYKKRVWKLSGPGSISC